MTPSPIRDISPGQTYYEKCGAWLFSVFFCRDARRYRACVHAPDGTAWVSLALEPKPHQITRLQTEQDRAVSEHSCPYKYGFYGSGR